MNGYPYPVALRYVLNVNHIVGLSLERLNNMNKQDIKDIEDSMKEPRKLTIKDRKKAQPNAVMILTDAERATIQQTIGKGLSNEQYAIFIYTCQALGLNPLLHEITAVTYGNKDGSKTMSLIVQRDGFLTIAHRSGKFAGLESGVEMSGGGQKIMFGWAKVYHKDFTVPVYQEADFAEYNTGRNLWLTKPKTMIKKVAESMALRKAFNVSGVYAPEEMEKEIDITPAKIVDGNEPASEQVIKNIKNLLPEEKRAEVDEMNLTKEQAAQMIQDLIKQPKK